jgi:hypothetical protein
MPLYRVRRERCIPYDIVIRAPDQEAAESAAYRQEMDAWNEDSGYWQDVETEDADEDEYDPDFVVDEDGNISLCYYDDEEDEGEE